jgi:hypothetical protein
MSEVLGAKGAVWTSLVQYVDATPDDLCEIEDGHVELTLEEIICSLIEHIVNEVRFLRFAACSLATTRPREQSLRLSLLHRSVALLILNCSSQLCHDAGAISQRGHFF